MTLLQTDFLPNKSEAFQAFRYLVQDSGIHEGVVGSGDFKAIQHTPNNMTVDVAAGSAWVMGGAVTRQGIYHQVNDATVNVGNFSNSDATNPRLDQVLLVVNDSSAIGGNDNPQFVIAQGAPTAGATLDNRSGAVLDATLNTTYYNWMRICDALIPANSTSVVNANIRDRRTWARGAYRRILRSSANYTIATATVTPIDSTNLNPRIECSGNPMRVLMRSSHFGAPSVMRYRLYVDGVAPEAGGGDALFDAAMVSGSQYTVDMEWVTVPVAGSHLFAPQWAIQTGTGTATLNAGVGSPLVFTIEEIVRQNADNT